MLVTRPCQSKLGRTAKHVRSRRGRVVVGTAPGKFTTHPCKKSCYLVSEQGNTNHLTLDLQEAMSSTKTKENDKNMKSLRKKGAHKR